MNNLSHFQIAKGGVASVSLTAALLATSCSTVSTDTVTHTSIPVNEPVIALVLGGGGAKGYAHIGVLKALESHNIAPNLIVGTSVGSFVGSLYASGKSANELEHLALTTPDSALTDFTLSYQGVIEGKKLRDFVNTQVNQQPIESFPIRFGAVAAEKHTLEKAVFTKGEAGLVVQASSSVPNLFIAPRIPDPATSGIIGKKYVDGGIVSIVPVDTAKSLGADVVIAVDLQVNTGSKPSPAHTPSLGSLLQSPSLLNNGKNTLWSLIEQGYNAYASENTRKGPYTQNYQAINRAEIARADIIIRPDVADISAINTLDREQAITAGFTATEQNMPAIIEAIKAAHHSQ